MKRLKRKARSRKAWAIVMRGGKIDELALRRKDLYPMTDAGERYARVLVTEIEPAPKKRKERIVSRRYQ